MSVVSAKAPNPEKGKRYLGLLDQALCNGNWSEIPELARKVDKHAPERKCLTLAARSEAQVASASHRPTSASSTGTSSLHSLSEAVPKLVAAIGDTESLPDDAHCGKVCLAEIYWLQQDPEAALNALPPAQEPLKTSNKGRVALGWLEVCAIKSLFIRATALEACGQASETQATYQAIAARTPGSRTPELRIWTERSLARACMHSFERISQHTLESFSESLRAFHAWNDFWQRAPVGSDSRTTSSQLDVPRRQVWKAYYDLLSMILQQGLIYNPLSSPNSELLVIPIDETSHDPYVDVKTRQRVELNLVEATYESLLLGETSFPKSSQSNTEVEEWVEKAVTNWKIICGPKWSDAELGEGGKEKISRRLLDIIYRAATKTFHSTAILRQLFTVHVSLGEFDLAMDAFGSYEEIASRGKARAEKTGEHELGSDDDDTVVLTAVQAVRVLCKYGDREHGEKALEIGKKIQIWLSQQRPTILNDAPTNIDDNTALDTQKQADPASSLLQPKTLAAAYWAVGISKAHWAWLTYETDTRARLHAEAIDNLRHSDAYEQGKIETSYGLAQLLGETREISAAIEVIKKCIAEVNLSDMDENEEIADVSRVRQRQRELIPIWHLLSLCLTAREEYEPGAKMCEVAFEQFSDSTALFGQTNARHHGDELSEPGRASRGLVDQMDNFEKEGILQVKMTQLLFVELMEGASVAVDMTDELLSLYARLFGNPESIKPVALPPTTAVSATPSKGPSTLRNIAGSIRPKSNRNSAEKDKPQQPLNGALPARPRTNAGADAPFLAGNGQTIGAPIAITVTNEDGDPAGKEQSDHHHHHHIHLPFRNRGQRDTSRNMDDIVSEGNFTDVEEKAALENQVSTPTMVSRDMGPTDHIPTDRSGNSPTGASDSSQQVSADTEELLRDTAHAGQRQTLAGHQDQLYPHPASSTAPAPRVAALQDRQHKVAGIVKVWLFIAGLYVRADLHDDANGAVDEAFQLVEAFETEKGSENSSARTFSNKGWGGGKSVDELWADVWSVKGTLALARDLPFQALSHYEQALSYFPDHPEAIIGISDLLMDMYEEKMPAEEPRQLLDPLPTASGSLFNTSQPSVSRPATSKSSLANPVVATLPTSGHKDPTPGELNRLAARDRAYMLLSNLTKLGRGWDNPRAWYTLARSYELSKQMDKAKQALWWVIELEDHRPIRPWSDVTVAGYVL